jgi:hypothetical protein
MTTVIIYEETGRGLVKRDTVQVADTVTDKETAAWTAWTRGKTRPEGNYSLLVAGKRFSVQKQTTTVATPVGPM